MASPLPHPCLLGSNIGSSRTTKRKDEVETIICCVVAVGIWWLIDSQPSAFSWMLAGFFSFCLIAGVVIWRVFRVPAPEPKPQALTPMPKAAIEIKKTTTPR